MQAYRAYYDEGKFIPLEPVTIPKGSQAIVTVLDFPLDEANERQSRLEWLGRLKEALAESKDEEMFDLLPQGLMREPHGLTD